MKGWIWKQRRHRLQLSRLCLSPKRPAANFMARNPKTWCQELLFWALMLPALAVIVTLSWVALGLLTKLPEWKVEYGFAFAAIIMTAISLARVLCRQDPKGAKGVQADESARRQTKD